MNALDRWRSELAGWAIPPEILAQAPEPPWGFPVEMFRAQDDPADSPSRRVAAQALGDGGSVLDVGCGGGAAAMAVVPRAGHVAGVDSSADMLAAFGHPPLRFRNQVREIISAMWPEVNGGFGSPLIKDALALGLYCQVNHLLNVEN